MEYGSAWFNLNKIDIPETNKSHRFRKRELKILLKLTKFRTHFTPEEIMF